MPLAWATLAIYYSNLPRADGRIGLAAAFAAFAIWALWFSRQRRMSALAVVLFFGIVVWWISIRPSHDRNWRPEVAVMPRATINGDHVHLTGVRNFQYRSRNDFTVGYQERDVMLSHLVAIDFYVSYFTEGPVGHTFVSFIFDNAPPLSISIETRPEVGEGFAPVASLFKQFELIYVVGDERDVVGVRTITEASRCISIVSILRRTTRAGCSWSTWRGSTNSPITPNLSYADQQLHHQHRALRECRRPGRWVRSAPSAQRSVRWLPHDLVESTPPCRLTNFGDAP